MTPADRRSRGSLTSQRTAASVLALFFFAFCAAALPAQTITIKVIDGKTGRPVKDVCVGVETPDQRLTPFLPADKMGTVSLRLTRDRKEVDVSFDPKLGCGGSSAIRPVMTYIDKLETYTSGWYPSCAFSESVPDVRIRSVDFSTKDVLERGVVSANTCGKITATPHPGEVILFVRHRNLRERIHDWEGSEYFPM